MISSEESQLGRSAEGLQSGLLKAAGFRHAFFTRRGGVSTGPFSSLSFSIAVGDDAANVAENLRRAGNVLGVPADQIYFLSQTHSRTVVELSETSTHTTILHTEGDALIAKSGNLACAVRSADCVPILIANRATGAVAAVHSGWRGTEQNIVEATVQKLDQGGQRSDLLAAIGPHISLAAFEVSPEVATVLEQCAPEVPVVDYGLGSKPHVNLRAIIRAQLERLGLLPAHIDDIAGCTVSDGDSFFSYRRDGRISGRHLAAIVPRAT